MNSLFAPSTAALSGPHFIVIMNLVSIVLVSVSYILLTSVFLGVRTKILILAAILTYMIISAIQLILTGSGVDIYLNQTLTSVLQIDNYASILAIPFLLAIIFIVFTYVAVRSYRKPSILRD